MGSTIKVKLRSDTPDRGLSDFVYPAPFFLLSTNVALERKRRSIMNGSRSTSRMITVGEVGKLIYCFSIERRIVEHAPVYIDNMVQNLPHVKVPLQTLPNDSSDDSASLSDD